MLSLQQRKKMGNPVAIKLDKAARNKKAPGAEIFDEDYGLYKKLSFKDGIQAYANDGFYGTPHIILEFPITTSIQALQKIIPKTIKYFQSLEYKTTLKGKKVFINKIGNEKKNYGLATDLGQFYFFRNAIIRDLYAHYKDKGLNKTTPAGHVLELACPNGV